MRREQLQNTASATRINNQQKQQPPQQHNKMFTASLNQYRANDSQYPGRVQHTPQQQSNTVVEPKSELEKGVFNFLMNKKSTSNIIIDSKSVGSDHVVDEPLPSDPMKSSGGFTIGRVNASPKKLGGLKQVVAAQFASPNRKANKQYNSYLTNSTNVTQVSKAQSPRQLALQKQNRSNNTNKNNNVNSAVHQSKSMTKQSYIQATPTSTKGKQHITVTSVTKHTAAGNPRQMPSAPKMPTPLNKVINVKDRRAGSMTSDNKIETPNHTNKMHAQFARINMPNFYKLEKVTYSRGDVSEIGNKLGKKMDELEHMIDYERRKNIVTQREKVQLQQQVNNLILQQKQDDHDRIRIRDQVSKQSRLSEKLTQCLCALKDSMIYNYLVLDFYKEVQQYVQMNQFESGLSDEVVRHLNEVNRIMDQNNLNQVDYDSDLLERVRDECADYLKSLELNAVIEYQDVFQPIDLSTGLGEAKSDMQVREIKPTNSKQGLDKTADKNAKIARLRSGSRSKVDANDPRAPWDPHHKQCAQDSLTTLRQDNQAKQILISKLQVERDQFKKRIIDLKAEIEKVKEKQFKKSQVEKIKADLERNERDLYVIQVKYSKQDIELQRLKDENFKFSTDIKYLNDTLVSETNHKNEYKKALENTEHFQTLQDAVNHITGMLVSKFSTELTSQQKLSLQAIFGDSSVLHTLKQRLIENEKHSRQQAVTICELQKLVQSFKSRIIDIWKDLSLMIKNFNEVPIDEVNHYQMLFLKNLVDDKYSKKSGKFEQIDAQLEAELHKFAELNRKIQNAHMLEEFSRQNIEGEQQQVVTRDSILHNKLSSFVDPSANNFRDSGGQFTERSIQSTSRGRSIPPKALTMSLIGGSSKPKKFRRTETAQKHRKKSTATIKHSKSNLDITLDSAMQKNVVKNVVSGLNESSDFLIKDFSKVQQTQEQMHLSIRHSKSQNLGYFDRQQQQSIIDKADDTCTPKLGMEEVQPVNIKGDSPAFTQGNFLDKSSGFIGDIQVDGDSSLHLMSSLIQPSTEDGLNSKPSQQQQPQDAAMKGSFHNQQAPYEEEITVDQIQGQKRQQDFRHTFGLSKDQPVSEQLEKVAALQQSQQLAAILTPHRVQLYENEMDGEMQAPPIDASNGEAIQVININLGATGKVSQRNHRAAVAQSTESCDMEFPTEDNQELQIQQQNQNHPQEQQQEPFYSRNRNQYMRQESHAIDIQSENNAVVNEHRANKQQLRSINFTLGQKSNANNSNRLQQVQAPSARVNGGPVISDGSSSLYYQNSQQPNYRQTFDQRRRSNNPDEPKMIEIGSLKSSHDNNNYSKTKRVVVNDYQSMGGFDRKNSEQSLYSAPNNLKYGDNQTVTTSVERNLIRGRRKNNGLEIEGLFREDSDDEEEKSKSAARSQTKKRKKSKMGTNRKAKQLQEENEGLKKAMTMMHEKYKEMMLKEVVETPEAENRVTVGQAQVRRSTASDLRQSNVDDNLLSDVLGSKDQAMYDKLLGDKDLENSRDSFISEVKIETVLDQDNSLYNQQRNLRYVNVNVELDPQDMNPLTANDNNTNNFTFRD